MHCPRPKRSSKVTKNRQEFDSCIQWLKYPAAIECYGIITGINNILPTYRVTSRSLMELSVLYIGTEYLNLVEDCVI
jgi:hypothetical protein